MRSSKRNLEEESLLNTILHSKQKKALINDPPWEYWIIYQGFSWISSPGTNRYIIQVDCSLGQIRVSREILCRHAAKEKHSTNSRTSPGSHTHGLYGLLGIRIFLAFWPFVRGESRKMNRHFSGFWKEDWNKEATCGLLEWRL